MRDVLPGSPEGVTARAMEAVVSAVASHVDCANDTSSSAVDAAKARVSMANHDGSSFFGRVGVLVTAVVGQQCNLRVPIVSRAGENSRRHTPELARAISDKRRKGSIRNRRVGNRKL